MRKVGLHRERKRGENLSLTVAELVAPVSLRPFKAKKKDLERIRGEFKGGKRYKHAMTACYRVFRVAIALTTRWIISMSMLILHCLKSGISETRFGIIKTENKSKNVWVSMTRPRLRLNSDVEDAVNLGRLDIKPLTREDTIRVAGLAGMQDRMLTKKTLVRGIFPLNGHHYSLHVGQGGQ